ncbi:DNA polymerase III subunit delta [Pseudodonghicola flavimaris]|uniref:DNA-directed DNA polymerase n=1 Tax=Pseudodonghicola flavimaris TaxID=3050036 RepID=A0ABT7EZ96_9RHOB|nr:DNA polymerase III subunit delta [Pseudodonghicola flavimaris]MDK3017670.1 DNA polymerase III subunit delta [Pseudodonghicola flavimaris]
MKLSPRDADRYFAKPEPERTGLLIYGADTMRVALKRQQVLKALLGPGAEEEMRLTRLQGGDLRKDPAQLNDAVKAVGFFPGPRAVFVEDATDTIAAAVAAALDDWAPGDAQIVVAAGSLKATSKLRKAFELHPNAFAVGLYDDPPSREEIERTLAEAGIRNVPQDSMSALTDLANELGPGDFARLTEKIALYKFRDDSPLGLDDIAACAPQSTEAGLDDMLNVVAEGRSQEIGPLLQRLEAQGTNAVSLCIGATRHFRMLYTAAADPGGPAAGVGRLRPPVYGKRRDRVVRQAQGWGAMRLETALTLLTDTDLQLRSAQQTAPAMALMERTLIRLAMLGKR